MKLGVQLPEVERVARWPEYVAMARAAEDAGFDSIWIGDHLLYRGDGRPERGPWDCWTVLAGLAVVTERVELGPLVACTAFRPPGLFARGGRCRRARRRPAARGRGRRLEARGVPRVRCAFRSRDRPVRGGVRDRPPPARGRARHAPRALPRGGGCRAAPAAGAAAAA